MRCRIGARKTRRPEIDIDFVPPRVNEKPPPERLERALGAVGRGNAGAPDLAKAQPAVPREKRGEVEFGIGVKPLDRPFGPEGTIGANDRGRAAGTPMGEIADDDVIAKRIEPVGFKAVRGGEKAAFGNKHPMAERPGGALVLIACRQPDLERTHARQKGRVIGKSFGVARGGGGQGKKVL